MNFSMRFRSLELDKMIRSFHFWIIIALLVIITLVYYEWQDWFPWFWRYFLFEFKNRIIGVPFIIPILYASIVFWWRGSLIVWLLSAAPMLPRLIYYSPHWESLLRNIAFSFVPLTIVLIIALELRWKDRQRELMVEREKERQIYMAQIFKAQEDERRRIAQELHDGTTQELLVIANHAQALVSEMGGTTIKKMRKQTGWIRDAVLQVSEGVRRLSFDLRPSILDDVGLVPALRWLADRLNQESEIDTKVVVKGTVRKLRSETEVTIFRIVQEALSNVRRHSKATEAIITLKFEPESIGIILRDNGTGFVSKAILGNLASEGKLGIAGMEQRVKFLNGTLNIQSEPGRGTVVSIEAMIS